MAPIPRKTVLAERIAVHVPPPARNSPAAAAAAVAVAAAAVTDVF